jgi:hypothetical protein
MQSFFPGMVNYCISVFYCKDAMYVDLSICVGHVVTSKAVVPKANRNIQSHVFYQAVVPDGTISYMQVAITKIKKIPL